MATRELAHYRDHAAEAAKLLHVGDSPVDARLNATELAAWTTVSGVILNLDEAISK